MRRLRRRPSWREIAGELTWARVAAGLLVVLVLAGAGYAGYVLGKPDVEAEGLQAAAVAEGREAGAAKGAKQGYEQGFDSARERVYAPAYAAAYRDAYASEFERAGLDPPERIRVPR